MWSNNAALTFLLFCIVGVYHLRWPPCGDGRDYAPWRVGAEPAAQGGGRKDADAINNAYEVSSLLEEGKEV
ncbi:unnamed protein product [Toxocara canis]|uniref:Secreted protein n=1 Tax=Toxocara canis TaxID=6265 RepID=A0A183UHL7_TOXCA|nr:unnamed protein product [Toxocara canis]